MPYEDAIGRGKGIGPPTGFLARNPDTIVGSPRRVFRLMKPASSPDRTAALVVALMLAGLCVVFRLLPDQYRAYWNLTPVGALFLFCGARLTGAARWVLPFAVMLLTDIGFYYVKGWPMSPSVYLAFALYVALGLVLRRASGVRAALFSIPLAAVASALFFLLTNGESWLMQALDYPRTFAGLMQSYEMGLPFAKGTFRGDLLFAPMVFAAYALVAPRFEVSPAAEEVR